MKVFRQGATEAQVSFESVSVDLGRSGCANLDSSAARDREIRSLAEAAREYPGATLHIIALNADAVPDLAGGIKVHAASAWLPGNLGSGM